MNTKKKRSTFRRRPMVPGNTPPPIGYTNKAAIQFLFKALKTRAKKKHGINP